MSPSVSCLAMLKPLEHVLDKPLGEGVFWHPGDGSALERLFLNLDSIGLGKHAFLFLLAGLLTLLFFWSAARQLASREIPGRWGLFVELLLDALREQMIRPFLGAAGEKFLPVVASFFVYISLCNILGLIPFMDFLGHGGNTATASLTITGALAICSFIVYHFLGIREQGSVWRYIRNLFPRVPAPILPLIVVIELVAHVIRPCALAVRLFANMFAGHTLMAVLLGLAVLARGSLVVGGAASLASAAAMAALTFLELLVALVQAFVFTFLTTVFLSMAVHPEH